MQIIQMLMKKIPLPRVVRYAVTVLLAALFLLVGNRVASRDLSIFKQGNQTPSMPARVTSIGERETKTSSIGHGVESYIIHFDAVVTGGEHKGLTVEGMHIEDPFAPVAMKEVEAGDRVLLHRYGQDADGASTWALQEYIRSDDLLLLAGAFGLLLLIFGRGKGLNTILSLSFTCLAIFTILIPAILTGHNIYLATAVVCLSIILITLVMVNGYNLKSLSAGIGCAGGLATAGLLLLLMNLSLRLTGYVDEESAYLLFLNPDNPLDLKAIVFCAILLGALGATLDVSVSIASSLSEIAETAAGPMTFGEILRSGMNIGRDIMGTMANTLVLAYIGSSLSLVLLLIVYSNSVLELFNREVIVVEILQSLVGSIGLLVTIPITAVAWGVLAGRRGAPPSQRPTAAREEGREPA